MGALSTDVAKKFQLAKNTAILGTLEEEDWPAIREAVLFKGIKEEDLHSLLPCISGQKKSYPKDALIYRAGENISNVGLLLSGSAQIERYDYWGGRSIVAAILPGDIFGESYAASPRGTMSVNVRASQPSSVLFLEVGKVLHMCQSTCQFHASLIDNLVSLLASRNIRLNEKLTYVTQHTLRDKLLVYLSSEALKQGNSYFDIPFNRQQLADFLNADRSALSNELSKMKAEGILDYQKNHFRLLVPAEELNH